MRTGPIVACGVALLAMATLSDVAPARAETLGPNLVANGGFEAGEAAPEGWHWSSADPQKATVGLDDTVARAGARSARLRSELAFAPHVFGGLSQVIRGLTPDSEYVIRLWVKGKSVGICWFGGGPQWLSRQQLPRGDFDWTEVELRWWAPETPTDYELRVNVDSETEALWVDEVRFQELDPLGDRPRVRALDAAAAARQGILLLAAMPRKPEIDGDLSDWPGESVVTRLPQDAGVVMLDRRSDDDLSVSLRTAADGHALYLGIAVRDDVHWAPPEALAWTSDSVQVGFDPRHEKTPGGYGPHDSEYSFTLGNDQRVRVQCWRPAQGLGDRSEDIAVAVKRTDAETVYEAAVPWSALGAEVGAGGPVLGLNVLVNDNDGSGRRGYIELTEGIGKVKDPSAYVTALSSAARSLAVLPGRPVVYTDDPVDLRVVLTLGEALGNAAELKVSAVDAAGGATALTATTLEAGTRGLLQAAMRLPAGAVPVATAQVRAEAIADGARIAHGSAPLTVSDIKTRLVREAADVRDRLEQVSALAEEARQKGIATDYETVAITVAEQFVGYALDDLHNDRPARAEHVVTVLRQTLDDTEAGLKAYLEGTATPLLVPRFVTGPVQIREGAFWADTVVPTTGKREHRPVFFTGYGHFPTVVRDMAKLAKMGCNIIQIECGPNSTQPEEGVVTDGPVRDYIGRALSLGEEENVMVCFLASPHYFPAWALGKWPELQTGGGGFFGVAVDAPQARRIFETHLQTSLNAIGGSPALHSVCLSNEPVFTNWQNDVFRRAAFSDHLESRFGTIGRLNAAWGTDYENFSAVPILQTESLPREQDMTPLRYETARFNMLQFSDYHRFMADVVRATRPGTWTHAKVMCVPASRQNLAWGCDPEQFAWMGDLNGNDCWNMFQGFGEQYAANWMAQNVYYDIQRSMRQVPVFNTEDHIILDREQRLIPPVHTDFALWQGALHGRGASTIWVWERTYDRSHDFEGSIMHRPENAIAVGKVALDLQRLAPEVVKLQRARAPIALIYSLTAQLWSDEAHGAMMTAYEALNACGVPVRFISERQAAEGQIDGFAAVIAPALGHATDSLAQALSRYCAAGGKVWAVGEAPLCGRDEYNRSRELRLPEDAVRRFSGGVSARELWSLFLAEMQAEGIRRFATLTDAEGQAPWGVEYRTVRERDGVLVSVANLWGTPQTVRVNIGGRRASAIHDLRTASQVSGNQITLQPLEATVLRVR